MILIFSWNWFWKLTFDFENQKKIKGCAIGLGYCANTHLDVVIDKLQGLLNPAQKKSSGFFSFGSDKSDKDIEMTKCTVMLCYGYAAAKADLS